MSSSRTRNLIRSRNFNINNCNSLKRLTAIAYTLCQAQFIMKEQQKKEVAEQIKSLADDIAKSTSKVGDTNETYDKRKKQAEIMLFGLCEMYRIAHS